MNYYGGYGGSGEGAGAGGWPAANPYSHHNQTQQQLGAVADYGRSQVGYNSDAGAEGGRRRDGGDRADGSGSRRPLIPTRDPTASPSASQPKYGQLVPPEHQSPFDAGKYGNVAYNGAANLPRAAGDSEVPEPAPPPGAIARGPSTAYQQPYGGLQSVLSLGRSRPYAPMRDEPEKKDATGAADTKVLGAGSIDEQFLLLKEEADEKAKVRKKARRRKICIIVAAVLTPLMITAGILIYIFFPRLPDIHVNALYVDNSTTTVPPFSFAVSNSSNLNTLTLEVRFLLSISLYNSNPYNLRIDEIDLYGNLVVNTTQIAEGLKPSSLGPIIGFVGGVPTPPAGYMPNNLPQLGAGNVTGLLFPAKQNTTFMMPFTVRYSPDPNLGLLNDPAFTEILNACGITAGKQRVMQINYAATSRVARLAWLGYNPSISSSIKINCPASMAQIDSVITTLINTPNLTPGNVAAVLTGALGGNVAPGAMMGAPDAMPDTMGGDATATGTTMAGAGVMTINVGAVSPSAAALMPAATESGDIAGFQAVVTD
ncbi:hypothetical protein HK101_004344, partial [Irineochytrium annulatum]